MQKKVSLKDIAQAANVSVALVSYVLNDKYESVRINPDTAKRIKAIARELNYQPNKVAQSLKSGKSLTIGLIVADISNPFFGQLAKTIEDESNKQGYTLIVGSSDENLQKFEKLVDTLVNRQIDGFIIAPVEDAEEKLKHLDKTGIPYVLIDRYFEDLNASHIIIDNFKAMYEVTTSILQQNKEARVGYVCYDNNLLHTNDRLKGFVQAYRDFGRADYQDHIYKVKYNNTEAFESVFDNQLLMKNRPDVIVFSTNTLSLLGLKSLIRHNIRVPEELGVFCFDQSDSYDLFYCPVSYVHQPLTKIGVESVNLLLRKVDEEGEQKKITLNADIIIKQSSRIKK